MQKKIRFASWVATEDGERRPLLEEAGLSSGHSTQREQPLQRAWSCDPPTIDDSDSGDDPPAYGSWDDPLDDDPPPYMSKPDYRQFQQQWATVGKPAGLSSGDAPAHKDKSRQERYAVRKPIYNDIMMRLAGRGGRALQPSVDAFADHELHLCSRWWGPGSDVPNAMEVSWKDEPLLWLNPPFSMMADVVRKIRKDRAKAVLVCPHWKSEGWYKTVMKMAKRHYFYRVGTLFFEVAEGTVGGIKWPVWALYVDGSDNSQPPDGMPWRISKAAGRRWRRRNKAVPIC